MRGFLVLTASAFLACCTRTTPADVVRQAFDAAAQNDAAEFGHVVGPSATITFMNGNPRPLTLSDLQLHRTCRLADIRETASGYVFASGNCEDEVAPSVRRAFGPAPMAFQVYLKDGKILRVDRVVFPL